MPSARSVPSAGACSNRRRKLRGDSRCSQAAVTPRFTPGTIRMMDLDLRYADLLTALPAMG